MLMFTDPFSEMDRLTDRLFATVARREVMAMDAYRDGDHLVVHLDLPGIDPGSVDVTVEQNVVTVEAERSWPVDDRTQVIVAERPQGKFRRQLLLGESLDTERIDAHYDKGVLTLTIPVAEQAKARKIEVGSGDAKAIEVTSQAA